MEETRVALMQNMFILIPAPPPHHIALFQVGKWGGRGVHCGIGQIGQGHPDWGRGRGEVEQASGREGMMKMFRTADIKSQKLFVSMIDQGFFRRYS